jgi:hypothetical protein
MGEPLTAHCSPLTVVGECIGPGGLAGLQNRDGGASGVSGGFDSHTLPLQDVRTQKTHRTQSPLFFCVLCVLCVFASRLAAQADTTRPQYVQVPVSPMGAFFRSLAIPGWAQAKLDRRLTGAIFLGFEGIALGMVIKADRELDYMRSRGDSAQAIDNKKQEREDWITLLVFNHLFAALDGFVGSHLYDFPDEVKLRASPKGFGAVVTIPVRIR